MSIVVEQPGATPPVPGPISGFTPQQIIEIAMKRTERRGKTLDLKAELVTVIQELVGEHRWHWRKKSVTFQTEGGTPTYDLTTIPEMAGLTCERVCREGPKLFRSGTDYVKLGAIFETDIQEEAREATTQGLPGKYFMDGQDQVHLVAIPDAVYKVRIPMWVQPVISPDELADTVPLVPAYMHHILIKGLEAHIFEFTLGEGSAKFQAAQGKYDQLVAKAAISVDFADGRVKEYKSHDEAIRSTY